MNVRTLLSFTAAIVAIGLLCLQALPARAAVDRARLVQIGASVLKIEVHRKAGGYGLGSGVVVGVDRIVTNCHVTQDGGEIWVLRGGARWAARAQAIDSEHDLCVLHVPGMQAQRVDLGRAADLQPGQSLTAVGFTGGMGIQSSGGEVVALHPHDGAPVIQSSNWFTSGASGGGLFDDQLRLVGVLTFRLRGGALHYFSAPVEWLQPLLADLSRYAPIPHTPAMPPAFWQRAPERQPNFLRAAALQNERRWLDLQALAQHWGRGDSSNPAPWVLQGQALTQLGRVTEAVQALDHALTLAPDLASIWLQLGLLLQRRGPGERLQDVRRALQRLGPHLLQELDGHSDRAPADRAHPEASIKPST